jgi:hypothetical protein
MLSYVPSWQASQVVYSGGSSKICNNSDICIHAALRPSESRTSDKNSCEIFFWRNNWFLQKQNHIIFQNKVSPPRSYCAFAPRSDCAFEKHSYSLQKIETSITLDFFEGFQGGFRAVLVACGPWRCGFLQIRSILVFIQRCCLFLKIRMLSQIYQSCCLFLKVRMNGRKHERIHPRSPLSIQPHKHADRTCTAQPCVAHAYIPRSGAQRIYMNQALP